MNERINDEQVLLSSLLLCARQATFMPPDEQHSCLFDQTPVRMYVSDAAQPLLFVLQRSRLYIRRKEKKSLASWQTGKHIPVRL